MSPDPHLKRITAYCARTERCTHDVMVQLQKWGVSGQEAASILRLLYAGQFVDDARYLKSYIAEKWRSAGWGRLKIAAGLRAKQFDEATIAEALTDIREEDYHHMLDTLLTKKNKEFHAVDPQARAQKLLFFAASRGFEEDLVLEWLAANGFDEVT